MPEGARPGPEPAPELRCILEPAGVDDLPVVPERGAAAFRFGETAFLIAVPRAVVFAFSFHAAGAMYMRSGSDFGDSRSFKWMARDAVNCSFVCVSS